MRVLLVSTYELGRQPFGLASPAAWLRERGHEVRCADLALDPLPSLNVREAGMIGLYLPMHTATRLGLAAMKRIRQLNPDVPIVCFGLYAPMNRTLLEQQGAASVIGGEFEQALADFADRIALGRPQPAAEALVPLDRLRFITPDRSALPPLSRYSRLHWNGERRVAGYTEASRGCRHRCRHCPVVPVYGGRFRIVQPDVVLDDIRRQVEAGAAHITFGDPDFFNGPAHALRLIESVHAGYPRLSYDVTIKVEHLLKHRRLIVHLAETGCAFVTTAAESLEDHVLEKLDKGHTRAGFLEVVRLFRESGLALAPTFIPFTPWTTTEGYRDLLRTLLGEGLVDNVGPVQLALRLLVPAGSRLLELPDVRAAAASFDPGALMYRWTHPDPAVDLLASRTLAVVRNAQRVHLDRRRVFEQIWELVFGEQVPENFRLMPRATIPYMDEPWFC